ncbi:PAS domain S-box protein [Belnapia moabensis]|uniref:PAS domain S-box protein n=1 Tax=Belnapia moabensis TaxID=365533 RepID=UPI0006940F20|nr:PAS domain S-box protein [Belnapia moabensis]
MASALTRWLFDPTGLTPHGFCLLWEPWLIWTHGLANAAIGIAYFSIPLALVTFARRRHDLVFRPIFWLFAAFILLCGAGHWMDLLTLWVPAYGAEAIVKVLTAAISVATAIALWPLMPKAIALPSHAQIQAASKALAESEERYRGMFVEAPAAMHSLDIDGRIVVVSKRWAEFMGYSREEVVGRDFTEFLTPEAARAFAETWPCFLEEGVLDDVRFQMVRRSGEVAEVEISARAFRNTAGAFVRTQGVVTDVTKRVQAEEGLRHAQKMEAIGQLTGGIAHDFNNVLQAVNGNLELIRRRLGSDRPDITRLAGNALEAGTKAAGLTSQLLAVARRQRLEPRPLNPTEVVEGMQALLARTLGERVALRVEADPGVRACLADRNQLESALLNLAINARDAFDGATGTLTISVLAESVKGAADGWPPDGTYVSIAVRDDGPGMSDEVQRRACEPFFTTKAPGKGTGLGLAQIHGFAHQSGGSVRIKSAPGWGTEVAILLPASSETVRPDAAAPVLEAKLEAGLGETVLLVEDDAIVRKALAETLSDLRYRVVEAADADAALAMLESGLGLDVVLSDVMMPGTMDGVDLAAELHARCPGLPIVLATGRVDVLRGRLLPPQVSMLRKPLSRAGVAAAVRRALASVDLSIH